MVESAAISLIYTTFPHIEAARSVAKTLLAARLVACCNILPAMESHYVWEGKVEIAQEVMMLCKTTAVRADAAMAHIAAGHPYKNPAILLLPVASGAPPFMKWIGDVTT